MNKICKIVITLEVVIIALLLTVMGNLMYINKKVDNFKKSENVVVSMMKLGFGADSENTIEGSIYGKDYVATYHVENNNIVRELSWK